MQTGFGAAPRIGRFFPVLGSMEFPIMGSGVPRVARTAEENSEEDPVNYPPGWKAESDLEWRYDPNIGSTQNWRRMKVAR